MIHNGMLLLEQAYHIIILFIVIHLLISLSRCIYALSNVCDQAGNMMPFIVVYFIQYYYYNYYITVILEMV